LSQLEPVQGTYLVQGGHLTIVPAAYAFDPQELGAGQLLNVEFYERPLDKALQDLADLSGITVLLDPKVGKKAQTPVVATLQNVPLRTAVRLLADMADLKAVTVDNVLYVTTRANADALEKEETERGAPRPGPVAPITGGGPPGV
jgi:type II secretory pathway component HofQ